MQSKSHPEARKWFSWDLSLMVSGLALWLCLAPASFAQTTLIENPITITPTQANLDYWVENLVQDEVWRFDDIESFNTLLVQHVPESPLRERLRQAILLPDDPGRDSRLTKTLYPLKDNEIGVYLDRDLRKLIPSSLAKAVYTLQISHYKNPPFWGGFPSWPEVENFMDYAGVAHAYLHRVREEAVQMEGKIYPVITPENWRLFSPRVRGYVVDRYVKQNKDLAESLELIVPITAETIPSVAAEFAGYRDATPLERYLKFRLGKRKKARVYLNDILPPYIRKQSGIFQNCDGPNCYNSGLNVGRGNLAVIEGVSYRTLMNELANTYRLLKPEEKMQMGDLMVYASTAGKIIHASTYINPKYAFHKPGFSNFSPTVTTTHEKVEEIYFKDSSFQLLVFRIPEPNETAINPAKTGWKQEYLQPYFSGRALRDVGLTAQMSLAESDTIARALPARLRTKLISSEEFFNLLGNSRIKSVFEELYSMYQEYFPWQDYLPAMKRMGFHPLQALDRNVRAINRLSGGDFDMNAHAFLEYLSQSKAPQYQQAAVAAQSRYLKEVEIADEIESFPGCPAVMKSR